METSDSIEKDANADPDEDANPDEDAPGLVEDADPEEEDTDPEEEDADPEEEDADPDDEANPDDDANDFDDFDNPAPPEEEDNQLPSQYFEEPQPLSELIEEEGGNHPELNELLLQYQFGEEQPQLQSPPQAQDRGEERLNDDLEDDHIEMCVFILFHIH